MCKIPSFIQLKQLNCLANLETNKTRTVPSLAPKNLFYQLHSMKDFDVAGHSHPYSFHLTNERCFMSSTMNMCVYF